MSTPVPSLHYLKEFRLHTFHIPFLIPRDTQAAEANIEKKKPEIKLHLTILVHADTSDLADCRSPRERWGAGVETQKNVREEIGGWGRVPFNEPYAPLLSTIDDGA